MLFSKKFEPISRYFCFPEAFRLTGRRTEPQNGFSQVGFRDCGPDGLAANPQKEAEMLAYVLVLLGVLSRYAVAGHLPWLNFTAVTGSLVYFGARRSWREMFVPVAVLMASDYCLTMYTYHYPFHWQGYVTTWAWYL